MNNHAKILNGSLTYYELSPDILGDQSPIALEQGFKPVIEKEGTGGTYETEDAIIIESLPVPPTPPTLEEIQESRKQAYQTEADPLYIAFKASQDRGETEEQIESLRTAWLSKIDEIKERFPKP